jgi:hypothetical protein
VDFPRWTEAIAIDQPKPDPDAGGVAGGTLKPDPESGSGTDIAPERGGGGGLGDREVDPAIPVKIRNGRRTSFAMDLHPGIVVGKESALAIAQQPQAAPGIIPLLHWMTGRPVLGEEEVLPTVAIGIRNAEAKRRRSLGKGGQGPKIEMIPTIQEDDGIEHRGLDPGQPPHRVPEDRAGVGVGIRRMGSEPLRQLGKNHPQHGQLANRPFALVE